VPRSSLKIRLVEPDSPAARAGLAPGDEILSLNGHPIPDELAFRFFLAGENHAGLEVLRPGAGELYIAMEISEGSVVGIEVEDFRTRTCNNACMFCFINQLPDDARKSLKIRDDDYRLSFLHGNYITLTNLPDKELDRIIEQALSPLYVSVHATDPGLRTMILGRKKPDDLAAKMRRLTAGGIRIHAQIVLLPRINDGAHLARTVFDLFSFYPGVASVAIVPLGLSDYGNRKLTPADPDFCRRTIAQVEPWRREFRARVGSGFAYLADEFYIQAGMPLPAAGFYDDFAQIEDGVGMVRRFIDDFAVQLKRRGRRRPGLKGTLATGILFSPFLQDCTGQLNRKLGTDLRVVEVENRYLGKGVTVAGLLAGRDFARALGGNVWGDFVMIPAEAVSQVERIFVDSMTPAQLAARIGARVIPGGPSMREFFDSLLKQEKAAPI
jgi:putative radical SAM enzyme (TIGR03279 family)